MNVVLISQCEKRALVETRRILDQFAERRGNRTWQTSITQIGLDTLRRMLKKTARKNTAVACHWIRGQDRSELLWIVGDASGFNERGAVPTNTTELDVLRTKDENTWNSLEDIGLIAILASLFHDFGKASRAFQQKLKSPKPVADAYRHEWVSLRLFESFVGEDGDVAWLSRLASSSSDIEAIALERLIRDDRPQVRSPFARDHLPALAQAVGWLIVSHHRLPTAASATVGQLKQLLTPIVAAWNGARNDATPEERAACWSFPNGTPFNSRDWRRRAAACAKVMLDRPGFVERAPSFLDDSYIMHLSRLALMLADHHYSSCESEPRYGDAGYPLFANTDRKSRGLKQRLDEHLAGVASHARRVVKSLPRLDRDLPRIARCKAFQKRSADERFRWQDRAYDLAMSIRERTASDGFFGVNMASTGCGKTLANGRILYGLADRQRGARFTVALGLRTLTLQTGEAYRERLHLDETDLAVLVGGPAVRELFDLSKKTSTDHARVYGSESAEDLLSAGEHVYFEGNVQDGPLKRWLGANSNAQRLVQAPVLVCTIDHIMPATEGVRAGRQIGPMLRLLTSDLVLDEPDDFELADLPALARLVNWAGLLGSRVLLSSATLPPALVEALFDAYRAGRAAFQKNRGEPAGALAIPCAWFDEFRCEHDTHQAVSGFRSAHEAFVDKRLKRLREASPRRMVEIIPTPGVSATVEREEAARIFGHSISPTLMRLHDSHHEVDPTTQKRASAGLVRFANIGPLITAARALVQESLPTDYAIHLCVYHSRHPLLMRSAIEDLLDGALRRHGDRSIFRHPSVRQALERSTATNHLFVVLASPVAEVGRDHDYDWAIVEPSSMRSIIQLAGRILRHRGCDVTEPNVLLLSKNFRAISDPGGLAYIRPGFEGSDLRLESHDLREVLDHEQVRPLDAAPRIRERRELEPRRNLVDLEHAALRAQLLERDARATRFCAEHWWSTRASLSGILQQALPFRRATKDEGDFGLLPVDEDGEELALFERVDGEWMDSSERRPPEVALPTSATVRPWGPADYLSELRALAERTDLDLRACAERYGCVTLRRSIHGWGYHPWLGFQELN